MAPPISATVRHQTKNHVTITPERGYSVVLFNLAEGSDVEAFVASDDGEETIRLLIAGPGPHQTMSISTDAQTGVVNIHYTTTPENQEA